MIDEGVLQDQGNTMVALVEHFERHLSVLDADAKNRLQSALADAPMKKPRIPVISNVDARPHDQIRQEVAVEILGVEILAPEGAGNGQALIVPEAAITYDANRQASVEVVVNENPALITGKKRVIMLRRKTRIPELISGIARPAENWLRCRKTIRPMDLVKLPR